MLFKNAIGRYKKPGGVAVISSPTLATLTLSGTLTNGSSSSGTILGATTASTIVSNVTGLTVNSALRTYAWDGTGTAGSTSNGLVETLAGAIGSPKNSSITVAAATVTLGTLSLSGTITNGTSSSGTITGASTGSTIVSNVTGLTVNSGARTYSWDGTGAAGATSNGLVETLSGAIGSPKNSSITVAAAAGATPDTPVLSNLSSGWTTGDNPPAWKSTYTNVQGYASGSGAGDQVKAHWKLGAGAWTATAWEPLDTELATGTAVPWPFLTDGTLAAGGAFQVWEEIVRDLGLGTEQTSAASNTWTDTIAAIVSETATGWATVTGANKSQYVTTTGGPPALVFQGQSGFNGAPTSARALNNRAGKRQFQITMTGTTTSVHYYLGVDDGTTDYNTGFVRPGKSNSAGVCLEFASSNGDTWTIWVGTVAAYTGSCQPSMEGDIFTCVFDTVNHTIAFYQKHSGTTTQLGATVTLPTYAAYYANVGNEGNAVITAKFGSGQDRALDSGADYYDK